MRGLCSWALCPSVGQACEKEHDVIPFSRVEAGAGLGEAAGGELGLEEAPHPLLIATEFISSPPPAPSTLNLRMDGNLTVPQHGLLPPQGIS